MRAAVAPFPRTLPGNPYCRLLYERLAEAGVQVEATAEFSAGWLWRQRHRVAVLHLHWPEFYYRGAGGRTTIRSVLGFLGDLLLARLLGYRIVWTVHNASPHEPHVVDRIVRTALLRTVRPVVHCSAARTAVADARWPAVVIPHGNYIGCYPDSIGVAEARRVLGIGAGTRVFLCFGQIRTYKGVAELVQAFHRLADPALRLVIAGRPASEGDAAHLRAHVTELGDPRIQLHLKYVPDDEVQVYLNACDWVVLPYRRVLTSGAAMLALSFGRALVVPRLGCLCELASRGCAIDYDPEHEDGLRQALELAARTDPALMGRRARAIAESLGWERIARAYLRVYGLKARGEMIAIGRRPARHASA